MCGRSDDFLVLQVIFRTLYKSIASTLPNFDDPKFVDQITSEVQSLKGKELPGFLNLQAGFNGFIQRMQLTTMFECSNQHHGSLSLSLI